ncbi:hypothetical protein [Thermus tengchongensis]|uniref:hypothetical protein n=1 Tax=Thermus tengchongensis TaxID=1214928 RepID=UPI000B337A27|nr:hypothetical protein [Thermus tengchongensis]
MRLLPLFLAFAAWALAQVDPLRPAEEPPWATASPSPTPPLPSKGWGRTNGVPTLSCGWGTD